MKKETYIVIMVTIMLTIIAVSGVLIHFQNKKTAKLEQKVSSLQKNIYQLENQKATLVEATDELLSLSKPMFKRENGYYIARFYYLVNAAGMDLDVFKTLRPKDKIKITEIHKSMTYMH